jgi:hypothetical protein
MVPGEIVRIADAIEAACHGKRPCEVTRALWIILLSSIMAEEGCSITEAVEHARDFCNKTIARHRH